MEQRRSETNDGTVFHKNECIGPFYQKPPSAGYQQNVKGTHHVHVTAGFEKGEGLWSDRNVSFEFLLVW